MANLDSGGHQRFVVDAPAFAARPSADPRVVDLNMLFRPATDTVLVRTHHARAQFVQDAEGGFVSRQPELPLKLHRRHPRRLAGDEVRGPEPDAERRMTALHDRADEEAGLATTSTALHNAGPADNAERFGDLAAMRADKAVRPTGALKIGGTRRVIGKQLLKLRQRLGKARSSRWRMSMAATAAKASPSGCILHYGAPSAPLAMQLAIYFLIGSICAVVNVAVFSMLFYGGLSVQIATPVSFAIAAALNYVLCVAILFYHKARWNTFGELAAYLCTVLFMGLVDYGLTIGFVAAGVTAVFSKVIAAVVGFVGNFLLRRFFIFPQPGVVRI